MLNRYPLWKYLMLVGAIFLGLLYALPNLYGEDPAIQISANRGTEINHETQNKIQTSLINNKIEAKSIILENNSILIRFSDNDKQLKAKDIISKELGNEFIVALNLVPATPGWLSMFGAKPMKLGLDLRGGVHFLMEVDIKTALDQLNTQAVEDIKTDFKKNKITFTNIKKDENDHIIINFNNNEAIALATKRINLIGDYTLVEQNEKKIVIKISENKLQQTKNDAVAQNTTILRNRVNQLGVAEPIVQRQGANRIIVELPGIQDTTLAKQIIGATATLEFRRVNDSSNYNANEIAAGRMRAPVDSEIKLTEDGSPILVYKKVVLTGNHITDASFILKDIVNPIVSISLDHAGGNKMFAFTRSNKEKPMATLFVEYKESGNKDENGKPILEKHEKIINVATIRDEFSDRFQVTGINSVDEAKQLSLLLRAGALIAPVQIIEELTVGPSMGQENIIQGLESCLWGLLVSVIFMLIVYKFFGVFASLALIANLILIVGIMSLLPGATLSMPGIAGIVLTVGMAVDANVLINERIKEELKNGRSPQHAIHEGYSGAWSSIFDANITTLITAIILYAVGTGSIKGFAITLGIGILTSMFTSIVGTRALANLIYGKRTINKLSI